MHPDVILARVTSAQEIAPDIFHITLHTPALARAALPGQFVMVRAGEGSAPLLRRPFSICGAAGDEVSLLFQVRGAGTLIMSRWISGQEVSLMGPLGNGFSFGNTMSVALLVAGGIGIAPMLFLAEYLQRTFPDVARHLIAGAKSKTDLALLQHFELQHCHVYIATEDGSLGEQGLVTDVLLEVLQSAHPGSGRHCLFGCGPHAMAKALADIAAQQDLDCQLALEARMACGTGACLGCVVAARDDSGGSGPYRRVCVDGPVFESRAIDWKLTSSS
ncbi:dihydroorotate dehydrogenase electron transfer subunit [Thermodesulfobacteriota bacterium]